MQIILQEDVEKLGTRGEVVEVAAGYARNYLLPHKLALEANASNVKRLEKIRATLAKRTATEKDAAHQQAALLSQVAVKLTRKAGENDQLFGSVTSADLADALQKQGFEIDKRRIELDEPIKTLGDYTVSVRLHRDVSVEIPVHSLRRLGGGSRAVRGSCGWRSSRSESIRRWRRRRSSETSRSRTRVSAVE